MRISDWSSDVCSSDLLGDQRARDMRYGFKDQLLEPVQRGACRSGMDRADAAGMAGAPRLEQIERFGAAHFADRDAIGTQAQACADELGHCNARCSNPRQDMVG